jgi:hypothetical protein
MFSFGIVQHTMTKLARTDLRETNAHHGEPVKTKPRKVQPRVIASDHACNSQDEEDDGFSSTARRSIKTH